MSYSFKKIAAVGAQIGAIAPAGCDQKENDPNHINGCVIVGAEQTAADAAQKVPKE
ncbi:MAG TPA: methionine ABC transporter substrate-binding protein MetQ, partial [Pantoea sp.]|nr:methionine ABC transporter substrate-binding protein MetQ [Pantoea sp.]